MTFEDDRSGRPSTCRTEEMIEKLRQLIRCDRRMSLVELEQEVGICHGSSHAIMTEDLKMRRVSAKFVPRQLTTDQMECRMMVAGDLFEKSTQDPTFLTKIVMGVLLRPGDEGAVSRVAHIVSPTKEITPRQIPGKSGAHCIF